MSGAASPTARAEVRPVVSSIMRSVADGAGGPGVGIDNYLRPASATDTYLRPASTDTYKRP